MYTSSTNKGNDMQPNSNTLSNIDQLVTQHHDEEGQTHDYNYHIRESWIRELGAQNACLFAMITSLSTRFGFCFIKTNTMAEKFSMSVSAIERALKYLEDAKWIFRNSYSTGRGMGSKRYIVTKENAIPYWKNYLSKESVPKEVRARFLKHFFGIDGEELKKSEDAKLDPSNLMGQTFRPVEIEGSYDPSKATAAFSLTGKNKKKTETDSPPSSILDVHKLEKELREYGFKGEQLEVGKAFFEAFKSDILQKRKPIGYVINAVEKGYAADEIQNLTQRQTLVNDREEKIEENKREAAKVYAEFKEKEGDFRVHLRDNLIQFDFGSSSLPIGWTDRKFDTLLSLAKKKVYELLRTSDESHSVATC